MKRLTAMVLSLVLILAMFAGCAKQETPSSNTNTTPSTNTQTNTTPATNTNTEPTKEPEHEKWPTKTITCIINWTAGGQADVSSRALCNAMEKILGVPVQVVNKEGGSGTVGMATLAASKPDGQTFGMVSHNALCLLPFQMDLTYTIEDFNIFTTYNKYEYVVACPASIGVHNLDEFFEWAKANLPDGVKGLGAGYPHPVFMQKICDIAGVPFTWVNTNGTAETIQNLLGEHAYLGSLTSGDLLPYIETGELVALAAENANRVVAFPDLPTAIEQGYDVSVGSYAAFAVPAGTEQWKVDILKAAFDEAIKDPVFQETFNNFKMVGDFRTGEEYMVELLADREMYREMFG